MAQPQLSDVVKNIVPACVDFSCKLHDESDQ